MSLINLSNLYLGNEFLNHCGSLGKRSAGTKNGFLVFRN
jgi:hypothetical protein